HRLAGRLEVTSGAEPKLAVEQGADLEQREQGEHLGGRVAEAVAADLSEIDVREERDCSRRELVPVKWHVAVSLGGCPLLGVRLATFLCAWLHEIVLHAAGCSDPHPFCFDESCERSRDPEASVDALEEHAVEEGPAIELEEGLG